MKRDRKYTHTAARGLRIGKTKVFPLFSLLTGVLLLGIFAFLFIWFGLPLIPRAIAAQPNLSCIGLESEPRPTPEPTASPLPAGADRPLFATDLKQAQTEWVVPDRQYLTDVSVAGDTLVAAAGDYYAPDGTAAFTRVLLRDLPSGRNSLLTVPQLYQNIRFPRLLGNTLVYLDVRGLGGGRLMACHTKTGAAKTLKTIHMGVPYLAAEGTTVCWIERTGTSRFKLFACDVTSGESVTLAMGDSPRFGASRPHLQGGLLVWAGSSGSLNILRLKEGAAEELRLPVEVHDPQTNGREIAFLSAPHGPDADLYLLAGDNSVLCIATDVADFAMGTNFIAYNTREKNYVYFFEDGSTFCITRGTDRSLLLAAGGNVVVWQNVSWRDKDIVEYMEVE